MRKIAQQIAARVIYKTAGYFQNVVGYNDPEGLTRLREANKVLTAQRDAYHSKRRKTLGPLSGASRRETLQKYQVENPLPTDSRLQALGGTELGTMGKYLEIPGMLPFDETAPYSGRPTREGHLSRNDLIKELTEMESYGQPHVTEGLLKKVKASPHKYYTSTKAS